MTAPPRAQRIAAASGHSGRQLEAEINREVATIQRDHTPHMPSGRCRVCQHPDSRKRVNTLLGYGMREAEILEFVEDINEKRSKNNQITYDSLRNHRARHFNVQEASKAGYRRILERRKNALAEEYGEGTATLLTSLGYLEITAQKGFEDLVHPDTKVPFDVGLQAQLKLETMLKEGKVEEQIAQMRRDVGLIQQAVMDVADEATRAAIMERLDELTGKAAARPDEDDDRIVEAEVVSDDFFDQEDDEEGFSPVVEADDRDSMED